ncbi:MAG: hypothetical protein M1831_005442 [Alyxoria varia]|nr:MAG: hypothetical protein M1831_005442 [Alyxoria varia]
MATTTENEKNLADRNTDYAKGFAQGHLASPPADKVAIVTCMDARIDPSAAFGIPLGSAHVIRNAGGSARLPDALRSLLISQHLLGTTDIFVIKHTKCGMATFKGPDAVEVVRKNCGEGAAEHVKAVTWGEFESSLEDEVTKDVEFLRNAEVLPGRERVSGWVYDVETGKVNRVA